VRYDNDLVPPYINKFPTSTANSSECKEWLQIGYMLQLVEISSVKCYKGHGARCSYLASVGVLNLYFEMIRSYKFDFILRKKFVRHRIVQLLHHFTLVH
jgi:hypothetical protein